MQLLQERLLLPGIELMNTWMTTRLYGKVSELQEKASFTDLANPGRRIPPGLSVI